MDYIFKSKIGNQEIRNKLLEQIDLIPKNPLQDDDQDILHTDWNLPSAMHREYSKLFLEIVKPHLEEVTSLLGCKHWRISRYWFQKYGTNGHHGWHTHPNTHFSNVYYLECPEDGTTKFEKFDVTCEEGDVLTFPAFLPHHSIPSTSNNAKTIISFNCDFDVNPIK